MRTLIYEDLWVFIVAWGWHTLIGLEDLSLWETSSLISRILRDPFLMGLAWLGLIVGHKIFPYILMRGGQVRPCQTRQRFVYPLQLPSVNFLFRLYILVVSFRCLLTSGCIVTFEVEPSTLSYRCLAMNAQVKLTSSLGPSPLPNMDEFINTTKLPLSPPFY